MIDTRTALDRESQRFELGPDAFERLLRRRDRKERTRRVSAAMLAIVLTVLSIAGLMRAFRNSELPATEPTPTPVDRGIFSGMGGWIVYEYDCITRICSSDVRTEQEIWGIDPDATEPKPTQLQDELGIPLAWSNDGTELLVIRPDANDRDGGLIILHADGTETSLLGPMGPREQSYLTAAISPDGSRVAYTAKTEDGLAAELYVTDSALYVMDVDSGRTTLLVEPSMGSVYQPTFSPDGTQIAYIDGGGDHSHSVWVVNADGSDPHMIVENEVTSR